MINELTNIGRISICISECEIGNCDLKSAEKNKNKYSLGGSIINKSCIGNQDILFRGLKREK